MPTDFRIRFIVVTFLHVNLCAIIATTARVLIQTIFSLEPPVTINGMLCSRGDIPTVKSTGWLN